MKSIAIGLAAAMATVLCVGESLAQVPPDIAAAIKAKGEAMDPSVAARLYAPLFPKEPYPGVVAERDIAYGADPLQKLDVFKPEAAGSKRPILLFVHGGGFVRGDKRPAGSPFNDNMMLWANSQGMVGVNINYRLAPKDPWPAGAQDLASAIAWVRANIARYGGDPDRIFIWGHSAGANHVADYVAHPEVRGAEVAGVKGAIIMSAFYAAEPSGPNAYYGTDARLQSLGASVDALTRSKIPLFISNAEYDPPQFKAYTDALNASLAKAGRNAPYVYSADHDHFSEGLAVGTSDVSVTKPLMDWINKTH
jgi:acetyl esterase/lipase